MGKYDWRECEEGAINRLHASNPSIKAKEIHAALSKMKGFSANVGQVKRRVSSLIAAGIITARIPSKAAGAPMKKKFSEYLSDPEEVYESGDEGFIFIFNYSYRDQRFRYIAR